MRLPFRLGTGEKTSFSRRELFDYFTRLKLSRSLCQGQMKRMSNKRQRHVVVTMTTLLGGPLVVMSRPASTLSSNSASGMLTFFRQRARRKTSILTISRSGAFTRNYGRLVGLWLRSWLMGHLVMGVSVKAVSVSCLDLLAKLLLLVVPMFCL